jgi:hypothetical protein
MPDHTALFRPTAAGPIIKAPQNMKLQRRRIGDQDAS